MRNALASHVPPIKVDYSALERRVIASMVAEAMAPEDEG